MREGDSAPIRFRHAAMNRDRQGPTGDVVVVTYDALLQCLRRKRGDDAKDPRYILGERGLG